MIDPPKGKRYGINTIYQIYTYLPTRERERRGNNSQPRATKTLTTVTKPTTTSAAAAGEASFSCVRLHHGHFDRGGPFLVTPEREREGGFDMLCLPQAAAIRSGRGGELPFRLDSRHTHSNEASPWLVLHTPCVCGTETGKGTCRRRRRCLLYTQQRPTHTQSNASVAVKSSIRRLSLRTSSPPLPI